MSTTPLPPAGFRVEPDMDVQIVRPVVVDGKDTNIGDVVTVDGNSAHIMMGEGAAIPTAAKQQPAEETKTDAPAAEAKPDEEAPHKTHGRNRG